MRRAVTGFPDDGGRGEGKTDPAGSIAAFQAIAGNGSVEPLLRDAAKLRAALIQSTCPGGRRPPTAALTGLAGREARTGGSRADSRRARDRRGDYDDAGKQLDVLLGDPEVSPTERQLAERWLGLVASNRKAK